MKFPEKSHLRLGMFKKKKKKKKKKLVTAAYSTLFECPLPGQCNGSATGPPLQRELESKDIIINILSSQEYF